MTLGELLKSELPLLISVLLLMFIIFGGLLAIIGIAAVIIVGFTVGVFVWAIICSVPTAIGLTAFGITYYITKNSISTRNLLEIWTLGYFISTLFFVLSVPKLGGIYAAIAEKGLQPIALYSLIILVLNWIIITVTVRWKLKKRITQNNNPIE